MSYDYEDKSLPELEAADTDIKEASPTEKEKKENDAQEYYELPDSPDARTRVWSLASLLAGILSVVLCSIYYVGIVLAVVSILLAMVSRRRLGYFDRPSVAGLLIGIIGVVFGLFSLIVDLTGVLDALNVRY